MEYTGLAGLKGSSQASWIVVNIYYFLPAEGAIFHITFTHSFIFYEYALFQPADRFANCKRSAVRQLQNAMREDFAHKLANNL